MPASYLQKKVLQSASRWRQIVQSPPAGSKYGQRSISDRPKLEARAASSRIVNFREGASQRGETPTRWAMRARTRRRPSAIAGSGSLRMAPTR